MTTKTKAEELAAALLEHAEDHQKVAHSFDMRPEDSLNWQHMLTAQEAAAELRRLAGVEAVLRAAVEGSRALIAAVTAERDDYLQRLNNLHISAKASREEADRLAAEVERLREDAERYRWLVSRPCDGDDEFYISAQDSKQASADGWWALGGDMAKEQADAYIDAARAKE